MTPTDAVQAAYERVAQAPHDPCGGQGKVMLPGPPIRAAPSITGCLGCNGTGKAHPQLWQECPGLDQPEYGIHVTHKKLIERYGRCQICLGISGWVLRPREDAPDPMDLAADNRLPVEASTIWSEGKVLWVVLIANRRGSDVIRRDATWLALDAAREGQDE